MHQNRVITSLVIIALLTGACASIERARVESSVYQVRADLATTKYRAHPVRVTVIPGNTSWYMGYEIRMGQDLANSLMKWPLLAHELAHHILGHAPRGDVQRMEMDANALAIPILEAMWSLSEQEAYTLVARMLLGNARAGISLEGHAPWCVELSDLARRYPRLSPITC